MKNTSKDSKATFTGYLLMAISLIALALSIYTFYGMSKLEEQMREYGQAGIVETVVATDPSEYQSFILSYLEENEQGSIVQKNDCISAPKDADKDWLLNTKNEMFAKNPNIVELAITGLKEPCK